MREVIRADLDPRSPTRLPTPDDARSRAVPATRARAKPDLGESPGTGKPFRRRRRSRPGRGRAEGQGRASRCSPPAPASLCSTPFCAAIRPPPGRCARASRCRAPRPPPRSCASTPTKPRCATCASPSATHSGPRRTCCRCGATAPAGRPASTRAGSPTRRRGSTWLCRTRTASHPA